MSFHPCQSGGACLCGGTCRRRNPGQYRRNADSRFRQLWRDYQQSGLKTDYHEAFRVAQRLGQTVKCGICNQSLIIGAEGRPFRNWIFCDDCYELTVVNGDEVPCEGYEGECPTESWVYHDKGYIDSHHYVDHVYPTVQTVEDLWCDQCFEKAIDDAAHEFSVNQGFEAWREGDYQPSLTKNALFATLTAQPLRVCNAY